MLLDAYQRMVRLNQQKVPAPEQALIALLLADRKRLVRDCSGKWNHAKAFRSKCKSCDLGPFNIGFKDKTIDRLVEIGRAKEIAFNEAGRSVEIVWVPV